MLASSQEYALGGELLSSTQGTGAHAAYYYYYYYYYYHHHHYYYYYYYSNTINYLIVPEDSYGGLAFVIFFCPTLLSNVFCKNNIFLDLLLKSARLRNKNVNQLHFNRCKSFRN